MSLPLSNTLQALADLENKIGIKPGQGIPQAVSLSLHRQNIIAWLTIKGVWALGPTTSDETLGKMYGIPNYLRKVLEGQANNQSQSKYRSVKRIDNLDFDSDDDNDNGIIISPNPTPFPPIITSPPPPPSHPTTIDKTLEQIVNKIIIEKLNQEQNQTKIWLKDEIKDLNHNLNRNLNSTFKVEVDKLKKLIEDTIFKSYFNLKIQNQENPHPEPGGEGPEPHNLHNLETNNQFIPPLDPNYFFHPYSTKVITSAISMNENLYVYGDTGCGKTTHLEQVAAVLNKGIMRVNPHDGITREMFLGGMKLINNETIFIKGALPLAMENGLIFLVDEISFLPPNLTAILNPIGEKGGKLYIPETSEWITPAPGFCIFATDNTGGKGDRSGNYTGTEVQNTATLDRFAFCLKMDYLPQEKEKEMLTKRFPNQDQFEINKMLNLAKDIRLAFSRGELSLTFSTRKLIKFFNQRENNFSTQEALSNTILSWLDEDDENLVKTMIDRLDLLNGVK